jgi:hypothetical protein
MEKQDKRKGEVTVSLEMVLKDLRIIFIRSRDPKHQAISIIPGKGYLREDEKEVLMMPSDNWSPRPTKSTG